MDHHEEGGNGRHQLTYATVHVHEYMHVCMFSSLVL